MQVNGGRCLRRCSSFVLPLCWAVSKEHWALRELICCRFANLTELMTLTAQKATGRLFCILHGRDSPVLAVKSSYAMLPAAAETSGSNGQFSMKLVGKLFMYLWKVYIQCHVHVPFFYTLFPCSETSPVKCLWRKCSQIGESLHLKYRKASYLITLSETFPGRSTSSVSVTFKRQMLNVQIHSKKYLCPTGKLIKTPVLKCWRAKKKTQRCLRIVWS